MEGPSTGRIQKKAFGCVKDRLGSREDGGKERRDVLLEDERRNGGREARTEKERYFLFSMHYTDINRLSWIICMAKFFDYHSDFNIRTNMVVYVFEFTSRICLKCHVTAGGLILLCLCVCHPVSDALEPEEF